MAASFENKVLYSGFILALGYSSKSVNKKVPILGAEIQCGDTEPVPFCLLIQVASPKGAVSPAQPAPSAPAWASALPMAPVVWAPNALWTPRPPAPWLSPALRYFSERCEREPSAQGPPTRDHKRNLNTHISWPRLFPQQPYLPPASWPPALQSPQTNWPEGRTTHQPS